MSEKQSPYEMACAFHEVFNPQQPEQPTDVVVKPNGEIATGESTQQPTVPIETNNLSEVTHVPTVTTPIETASGEAIVAVDKGVPLTQTADGLKPKIGRAHV